MHKRALSLVYNDFISSFSERLEKDKFITIYHRNLQNPAYEIVKVRNNMKPEVLTEIFPYGESNCNLRNSTVLQRRSIKTHVWLRNYIYFGTKYMGHFTDGIKNNCVS